VRSNNGLSGHPEGSGSVCY